MHRSNILFLAADCEVYLTLSKVVGHDHVAKPLRQPNGDTSGAQAFNSTEYRRFTVNRASIMQHFTDRGFNVLWQDVDTAPIKDPFDMLPVRPVGLVVWVKYPTTPV